MSPFCWYCCSSLTLRRSTTRYPEGKYFTEFNRYRDDISDSGIIDYEAHAEEFERAGISLNDLTLYYHYMYADKGAFSAEKMEVLVKNRNIGEKYNTDIREFFKDFFCVLPTASDTVRYLWYARIVYIFIGAAILCFILVKNKRLEILGLFAFTLVPIFYLQFVFKGLYRLVDIIALSGLIMLIYLLTDRSLPAEWNSPLQKPNVKRRLALLFSLVIILTSCANGVINNYDQTLWYQKHNAARQYIIKHADDGYHYIFDPETRDILIDLRLRLASKELTDQFYKTTMGDWWAYTHFWYSQMEELGYSEYADSGLSVVLDENTYYVTFLDNDTPDMLVTLFKEHYDLDVAYRVVDTIDNTDVTVTVFDFYAL